MMKIEPSLKVILWAARYQQIDIAWAIAHYGYPRLKPLLNILMELK